MGRALLCSAAWVAIALPSGAFAQQEPQSTSPAPSTAGPSTEPRTDNAAADVAQPVLDNQLGDIIVTAQRRSENVQRAAVPIAVISAQGLLKSGVSDPTALGSVVPALSVTPAAAGRPNFFVRGVGNFTVNPLFESAVAFNYDGVYIGYPGSTSGVFYDLERVEVLKGPQGTLYGRNATGGAINVLPVHPKPGELSGYVSGSYGNYDAVNMEGAINVPLGSMGAMRISGNVVNHDGYLTDGTSDEDTRALRVQMLGELTPALTVRVSGDYAHTGGVGPGVSYISAYRYNPASGTYTVIASGLDPSVGFYDPAAQAFRRSLQAGPAGRQLSDISPYPYIRGDFYGADAEIGYKVGAGELTLIPAWRYSYTDNIATSTGFTARTHQKEEQVSVEARFVSKRVGPID